MSGIALNPRRNTAARKKSAISDHAQEQRTKKTVLDMREKEVLFSRLSREHKLVFYVLYAYDLTKQSKSNKVRFVYLLKGRPGEKGIVERYNGKFLAPGVFIVPEKNDKDIQDIFALWKIKFKRMPVLTH